MSTPTIKAVRAFIAAITRRHQPEISDLMTGFPRINRHQGNQEIAERGIVGEAQRDGVQQARAPK